MPNVKLTYFNLRGRGEPCRIMLAYGNDKFNVLLTSILTLILAVSMIMSDDNSDSEMKR